MALGTDTGAGNLDLFGDLLISLQFLRFSSSYNGQRGGRTRLFFFFVVMLWFQFDFLCGNLLSSLLSRCNYFCIVSVRVCIVHVQMIQVRVSGFASIAHTLVFRNNALDVDMIQCRVVVNIARGRGDSDLIP